MTSEHSDRLSAFSVGPVVGQSEVATVVVTPRCFVLNLSPYPVSRLAPSGPSALRSSRLSSGVLATMTSADFPSPLSDGISLGQCRPCPFAPSGSTCAVDDSGASLILACSPAVARLTARSCSYGRRLASGPFARVPCGSHLTVRLRLSSSPRRGPFTPQGSAPARHTKDAFHRVPLWAERIGDRVESVPTCQNGELDAALLGRGDACIFL